MKILVLFQYFDIIFIFNIIFEKFFCYYLSFLIIDQKNQDIQTKDKFSCI
jgi:hypothetical protein